MLQSPMQLVGNHSVCIRKSVGQTTYTITVLTDLPVDPSMHDHHQMKDVPDIFFWWGGWGSVHSFQSCMQ